MKDEQKETLNCQITLGCNDSKISVKSVTWNRRCCCSRYYKNHHAMHVLLIL